ncbi:MAG TPA: tetratricopeptide repeat protein [Bryobacteraceae bacterium]|nr:tetratricopeptide repeat protein [Bryobacteraceae bacterium]
MRKGYTTGLATLAGLMILFGAGCDKLKSRDQINQGIAAFKSAKYSDAVEHFKQAAALDPSNNNAVVYMATAYFAQWIPGAESPENKEYADRAKEGFLKALESDPSDKTVLKYLGAMAYSQASSLPQDQKLAKFDEAEQWYKKLIAIDPQDKEAYYYLAVIDYYRFHPALMLAKVDAHMRPEETGMLKDKKIRDALSAKYSSTIDDGVAMATKALDIDKEYDDAMVYLELLIRDKAALLDNKDEFAKQEQVADNWLDKAMATRKDKAAKANKQTGGIVQDK